MHFSASTFMASYLHQISAENALFWYYLGQPCIIFGANLASHDFWAGLKAMGFGPIESACKKKSPIVRT